MDYQTIYVESKAGWEYELEIGYCITPYDGGDYWTPPEGGEVEVHEVIYEGRDITKLVDHTEIAQIVGELL